MLKRLVLVATFAAGIAVYTPVVFAQEPEHAEQSEAAKEAEKQAEEQALEPWKWANFALLAIGLGFILYKVLPKNFAERTAAIQKDIKEAQALKADAEKRAAAVEAKVASLGADIEKFRTESAKEMAREGERIRQETAAHIQRVEDQATLEIETAGKIARRELKQYSAELALKMAEDSLRARMDATAEAGLVDSFISELSRKGGNN